MAGMVTGNIHFEYGKDVPSSVIIPNHTTFNADGENLHWCVMCSPAQSWFHSVLPFSMMNT